MFGLVDLAIFLYPLGYVAVWPAVAGMVVVGLPGALAIAGLITLFQRGTADSHRGAGYVVAGLAMLAWLRDGSGEFMAREPHVHAVADTVQANA